MYCRAAADDAIGIRGGSLGCRTAALLGACAHPSRARGRVWVPGTREDMAPQAAVLCPYAAAGILWVVVHSQVSKHFISNVKPPTLFMNLCRVSCLVAL